MTRVKICGFTNREDCLNAAELGADALGFVFAESKRQVSPEQVKEITTGLPPDLIRVGIFVDETTELIETYIATCGLTEVQLYLSDLSNIEASVDTLTGLSVPYLLSHRVATYLNMLKLRCLMRCLVAR